MVGVGWWGVCVTVGVGWWGVCVRRGWGVGLWVCGTVGVGVCAYVRWMESCLSVWGVGP